MERGTLLDARPDPHPITDALEQVALRAHHVSAVGPSGTGMPHFCEALRQAAVNAGMTVARFTIEDLRVLVRRHRIDDSVSKAISHITRTDLVIADDIALLPNDRQLGCRVPPLSVWPACRRGSARWRARNSGGQGRGMTAGLP
ncbi:ATP-binding protein [Streptomyces sp. NPDC090088]|uniref:ATP-binding protein n=1 Tax=Streptomyces sp. NPDC090088 TaxID=3365944 RepID=UPI00380E1A9F